MVCGSAVGTLVYRRLATIARSTAPRTHSAWRQASTGSAGTTRYQGSSSCPGLILPHFWHTRRCVLPSRLQVPASRLQCLITGGVGRQSPKTVLHITSSYNAEYLITFHSQVSASAFVLPHQTNNMELPTLPTPLDHFASYIEAADTPARVEQLIQPFKVYESKLRQIYAQEPNHQAVTQNHLVPVYQDSQVKLSIKARDISAGNKLDQEKYLLPLSADKRRAHATNAATPTFREFKKNFDIFSESSLVDLRWANVVAAGSSVVTALLPVDAPHNESKVSPYSPRKYKLTMTNSEH